MPVFTLKSFTILFIENSILSVNDCLGNHPFLVFMTFGLETALPTHHPVEILRGVGLWGEWKAHISQQEERRHGVCKDLILKQPTPNSHLHTC